MYRLFTRQTSRTAKSSRTLKSKRFFLNENQAKVNLDLYKNTFTVDDKIKVHKYISQKGYDDLAKYGHTVQGFVTLDLFDSLDEAQSKLQLDPKWQGGEVKYLVSVDVDPEDLDIPRSHGGKGALHELYCESYPDLGVGEGINLKLKRPVPLDNSTVLNLETEEFMTSNNRPIFK